jgi:polyphosphate kinase
VRIDLVIRGICCLRPGVPGVSDNIRVTSIVDRFLEHSRIFYFENAGSPDVFLGSADWMPRNFFRRIEVMFPIEDPRLKTRIIDEILATVLADTVKARRLRADGSYERVQPEGESPPVRSQSVFPVLAREASREQKANRSFAPTSGNNGRSERRTTRRVGRKGARPRRGDRPAGRVQPDEV